MTMTLPRVTDTDEILAGMLTENTGRALCDSGGAYGRNWERNAGKTVADFLAAPVVSADTWTNSEGKTVVSYVTLDVFHFLRERLDYAPDLDADLHEFGMADERATDSWFACLDDWIEAREFTGPYGDGRPQIVNTYNGEDALSQIIQYTMFSHEDDNYVALCIHGGCDARGGYTAPRVFMLPEYHEWALYDNCRFTAVITEPPTPADVLAQIPAFPEYPVPVGNRQIVVDFDGGSSEAYRENDPYDDPFLDSITFEFEETAILTPAEGDAAYVIAEGPATGWTVHFHEYPAG